LSYFLLLLLLLLKSQLNHVFALKNHITDNARKSHFSKVKHGNENHNLSRLNPISLTLFHFISCIFILLVFIYIFWPFYEDSYDVLCDHIYSQLPEKMGAVKSIFNEALSFILSIFICIYF
jgi:hypothetical protein